MEFEFEIVGDELDLSDDEEVFAQVSVQASKMELKIQHEANLTAWKVNTDVQFQFFLRNLVAELQPRQNDYLARRNIVNRLSSAIEHMDSFRGAKLSTFGSFESNLYSRWADLDLSLELPKRSALPETVSKKLKVRVLKSLLRTLLRKGEARNLQLIPYARVPLITFEDPLHGISCDISVENDFAIMKSQLLRWINEIDSRCRDLVFLVKCWAKAHGINDPKTGTLNSFALCLLVIFHLQTRTPPVLPPLSAVLDEDMAKHIKGSDSEINWEQIMNGCREKVKPFVVQKFGSQNKSSVADLFISFFSQFSAVKELWSQGLAVCTFTGAWGDKTSTSAKWRSKGYLMAIEDPFDRRENCARSVQYYTFGTISKAFTSTADALCHPQPNISIAWLLEALFLWPVDRQNLGLQAWLSKLHSKEGKFKTDQINKAFMDWSIRMHNKAHVVEQHSYHRQVIKQMPQEAFLENSLDAQLRRRLQLNDSFDGAVPKRKKKEPWIPNGKISSTADVINARSGSSSEVNSQSNLQFERLRANESQVYLQNIKSDTCTVNSFEDWDRPQVAEELKGMRTCPPVINERTGGENCTSQLDAQRIAEQPEGQVKESSISKTEPATLMMKPNNRAKTGDLIFQTGQQHPFSGQTWASRPKGKHEQYRV